MALFYFGVTTCKTTNKWQKDGHFTTSVPVDPNFLKPTASFRRISEWLPCGIQEEYLHEGIFTQTWVE